MRLRIEKQEVFLDAVCTGAFTVAIALLAVDQSDSNLRISEAFPTDRASRLSLARFIAQGQFTETEKQNFSEPLFEKTGGKEGPPLNALELLVLEGESDPAKAGLACLLQVLRSVKHFQKTVNYWVVFGILFWMNIRV